MAAANQKTVPEKTAEEVQLEEELREIAQAKNAAFERSRKDDERLREIREQERQKQEKLHRIRLGRAERDKTERPAVPPKKTTTLAAGEMAELQQLRRQNSEQKNSLEKVKANLQSITGFARKQQKEKIEKEEEIGKQAMRIKCLEMDNVNQRKRVKCLEGEISAGKQITAETQLRQLNELQSLTKETRELKQTLTHLHHQQQEPAAKEYHQGKHATAAAGCNAFATKT